MKRAAGCEHLAVAPIEVPATSEGCADCESVGRDDWVHLRLCLSCGHVGCCDSSPLRHAQAHFAATRHPVMRSYEVGETWRWCFVDRRVG